MASKWETRKTPYGWMFWNGEDYCGPFTTESEMQAKIDVQQKVCGLLVNVKPRRFKERPAHAQARRQSQKAYADKRAGQQSQLEMMWNAI